jgi:hypothetical protein
MAQITSREELEAWLEGRPTDWAQVIAARAALRLLPYAFAGYNSQKWCDKVALSLFRAVAISWAARNIRTRNIASAAKDAYDALNKVSPSVAHTGVSTAAFYTVNAVGAACEGIDYWTAYHVRAAVNVADAPARTANVADAAAHAAANAEGHYAASLVWETISTDRDWLIKEFDNSNAARRLTWQPLWLSTSTINWPDQKEYAATRLSELDQGYYVWIDWYNRRIKGERTAFDIPGDRNRTEDKAILARLADATDEDFWGKGAEYVNTTLQSWIDDAREQAAINYIARGAPLNLGSEAELAARDELASRLTSVEAALAALKDQLASLTQTGHGGIGHNQPENATSLRDDEIITLKQQVASLETLLTEVHTQLAKPVPDVGQLVQDVPQLNRWGRAMCVMADISSDKVAEGFEKEIGAASARGLINVGKALVYTALCAFLLFFYTVWIPLLIG